MGERPTGSGESVDPIAWAGEHESGPGEEHERTLFLTEPGDNDCIQTWAEHLDWRGEAVVGFWTSVQGTEVRWDLTPAQARELAANLIVLARDAERDFDGPGEAT